jgi:hypothetical protein
VGVQCVTGQRLNCSEGLWRDSRLKREDSAAYQRCRKSSVVHDASVKNDGAFAPAASSLTNGSGVSYYRLVTESSLSLSSAASTNGIHTRVPKCEST